MENDDFNTKSAEFLSWLTAAGVKISPKAQLVDLRAEGRGRGVVAAADFEEDEIVFSIPRTAVLNLQNGLPDCSDSASQALHDMPPWLALTTLMVSESLRSDSRWAPYFAVLPQSLDSLVFWSQEELEELDASTVVHKIGKAKAEEMFSQHVAHFGLQNCSTDLCHRVASIIMAYAFDIPEKQISQEGNTGGDDGEEELVSDDEEDEKTVLSMIPLADMLNADADRNNARLCCDNEDLEMRTIKPISQGEEIFNDYGHLPRSDLLRRYGYVSERYAPFDVAELSVWPFKSLFEADISVTLPGLEPCGPDEVAKRIELAEREGVYEDSYDLAHPGEDGPCIPDELLALVYVLLVDDDTFKAISSSESFLPSRSKLATRMVGQVISLVLQDTENGYSTTVEQDEKLLTRGSLPRRTEMAIQVRLGEKKVLRAAIREARSFEGSDKRMRLAKAPERKTSTQNDKKKRPAEEVSNPKKKGRYR